MNIRTSRMTDEQFASFVAANPVSGGALGQLLIELAVNSARMQGGFDSARSMAQRFSADIRSGFNQLGSSFSELGAAVGASFGPLGGIISGVTQGIGAMSSALKAASLNAGALKVATVGILGIGGAAIATAAGFATLSQAGSKLSEEIVRQAEKLGVTTTQMAALRAAAEFIDLPVQTLTRGFSRFAKALGDVDNPTSKVAGHLRAMGITAGTGTYEGLEKAISSIQKMENPVDRMNMATALFGQRLGLQLLPMLQDSTHGLEDFKKMADEAGISIDEQGKKKTDEWKFATTGLTTAWDGLKLSFANNDGVIATITYLKEAVEWATKLSKGRQMTAKDVSYGGTASFDSDEKKADDAAFLARQAAAYEQWKKGDDDKKESEKRTAKVNSDLIAGYEHQFEVLKAGGVAAEKLAELEKKIKEEQEALDPLNEDAAHLTAAQAAAKWKELVADQGRVESLKEEVRLEKSLADTFENRSKIMHEAMRLMKEDALAAAAEEKKITEETTRQVDAAQNLHNEWEDMHDLFAKADEAQKEAVDKNAEALRQQGFKASADIIRQQHGLGLISEKNYAAQLIEIYKQEEADRRTHLEKELAEQHTKAVAPESNIEEQNAAKLKSIQIQGQINLLAGETAEKIRGIETAAAKNPFQAWIAGIDKVGVTLQKEVITALNQVTAGLAKSIVEGGKFGTEMKKIGQNIAESFINMMEQMLIKWLLTHTIMKTATTFTHAADVAETIAADKTKTVSAAGVAGAEGTASFAGAPWPIDMGAPAFGATMAATALSFAAFERGGISEMGGLSLLHPKEMVLPAPLSEKVQKMADPESYGGGKNMRGGGTTVNMNITTPNADSFGHSQGQIQAKAHLGAAKIARRNGGM